MFEGLDISGHFTDSILRCNDSHVAEHPKIDESGRLIARSREQDVGIEIDAKGREFRQ